MLVYLVWPYSATIASVEVIKETPKRFYLVAKSAIKIRGEFYYVPDQVDKDSRRYKVFADLADANQFVAENLRKEVASLEKQLEMAQRQLAEFEEKA